jgi:hypothetical protein
MCKFIGGGGGGGLDKEGIHSFLILNKKFYQLSNKIFILIDLTIKKKMNFINVVQFYV